MRRTFGLNMSEMYAAKWLGKLTYYHGFLDFWIILYLPMTYLENGEISSRHRHGERTTLFCLGENLTNLRYFCKPCIRKYVHS